MWGYFYWVNESGSRLKYGIMCLENTSTHSGEGYYAFLNSHYLWCWSHYSRFLVFVGGFSWNVYPRIRLYVHEKVLNGILFTFLERSTGVDRVPDAFWRQDVSMVTQNLTRKGLSVSSIFCRMMPPIGFWKSNGKYRIKGQSWSRILEVPLSSKGTTLS